MSLYQVITTATTSVLDMTVGMLLRYSQKSGWLPNAELVKIGGSVIYGPRTRMATKT
uniref:Uncharacterized protein n=1 Tax=Arundo donax TaxID=35708 RepID=A0A0A8XTR9_ARUDO